MDKVLDVFIFLRDFYGKELFDLAHDVMKSDINVRRGNLSKKRLYQIRSSMLENDIMLLRDEMDLKSFLVDNRGIWYLRGRIVLGSRCQKR